MRVCQRLSGCHSDCAFCIATKANVCHIMKHWEWKEWKLGLPGWGLYLDCKFLGWLAARAEVVYPKGFDSVAFSWSKSVGNILVVIKEMCCSVEEVKMFLFFLRMEEQFCFLYLPSFWVKTRIWNWKTCCWLFCMWRFG